MKPILGLIRWLWRHSSRTETLREGGLRVTDVVVGYCSDPTCTCERIKKGAAAIPSARVLS